MKVLRNLKLALLLIGAMACQNVVAQKTNDTVTQKNAQTGHRPKVGVVLSGGGAKGFAHIRALKAIEEAGIPIDFIGGTSMGSIIGGLYAVGYDPDVMEDLTTHQDWGLIIMDKVPRRYASLESRLYKRNYLLKLPIIDGKIKIKNSFVDGVYVNMLLTRLTLPAYKQRDFNKLSVPFFCVATDMTTADPVVWESGSMARAIRSSMSIPFLFAPVDYGDKLLCDGGLLNNFPVRLMREKGADIVIGIDLENDYIDKAKLDNSLKVLERLIAVVSQHESNKAREECDILIRPDIGKANMLSFEDFSPILKCGEEAGKAHEEELKALADSLQSIEHYEIKRPHVKPIDEIYISKVEVDGVGERDVESIKKFFEIDKLPRMFKIDDIEEIIVKNYSTGYYSDIWYEVKDVKGENVLVMHCKSNSYKTFGVTAHYDNNYRMQVLLNYSMMMVSKKSDRRMLSIDANLAENPYIKALYTKQSENYFKIGAELYAMLLKVNVYDVDKSVYGVWAVNENKLNLFLQFIPNLNQQLSLGLVGSYSQVKDRQTSSIPEVDVKTLYPYKFYPHFYVRYFYNDEDDADFARSGWNVDILAKCIFHDLQPNDANLSKPYIALMADVNKAFPIGRNHSIRVGAHANATLIRSVLPVYYTPLIGGQSRMKYMDNIVPFTGTPFLSNGIDFIAFMKTSWYWNMFKGLYTQVNCDFGSFAYLKEYWFDKDTFCLGAGLAVGYKTPVGPVELQLSKSTAFEKPVLYINLGFWF